MTTIAIILLLCLLIAAAVVTGCTLFVFAAWGHITRHDPETATGPAISSDGERQSE